MKKIIYTKESHEKSIKEIFDYIDHVNELFNFDKIITDIKILEKTVNKNVYISDAITFYSEKKFHKLNKNILLIKSYINLKVIKDISDVFTDYNLDIVTHPFYIEKPLHDYDLIILDNHFALTSEEVEEYKYFDKSLPNRSIITGDLFCSCIPENIEVVMYTEHPPKKLGSYLCIKDKPNHKNVLYKTLQLIKLEIENGI
jgi:hypothetical protein